MDSSDDFMKMIAERLEQEEVEDVDDSSSSLYTSKQQQTLQIVSVVTGGLSFIGSCWIIYQILTTPPLSRVGTAGRKWRSSATIKGSGKKKRPLPSLAALRQSVYLRLIMGLSVLDLLSSIGNAGFSNWAIVPEAASYVYNPTGSWTATEAGGFFTHLMVGTTVYSGYLSLYFVLLVRYEVKEEMMTKYYAEPLAHAHAILFPLLTGLLAASKGWFAPLKIAPGTIWLDDFPSGCSFEDSEIECIRGTSPFLIFLCGAVTILGALVVMSISMCLLVSKVRQTERQMTQYAATQTHDEPNFKLTRRTTIQALLYIGAYFLTYFGMVSMQVMVTLRVPETSDYRSIWFAFAMMTKIFTPLQGALNAFVFWYRTVDGKKTKRVKESSSSSKRVKESSSGTSGARPIDLQRDDGVLKVDLIE